ncbi:hypothetical protein [Bacillus swezeyi]|uniref:hypothetical protein n=1 Tax=Bacillus swezeyi TaxID=1925020 RepID=UPI003F89A1DD
MTMCIFLLVSAGISSNQVKASNLNESHNEEVDLESLEPVNLKHITNLDETLTKYNLKSSNITSTYSFKNEDTGIINLYDEESDNYVNFYIMNNKIEFQSVQKKLNDGKTLFNLYTNELELVLSETANSDGELEKKITIAKKPNRAALKWACIFSSYLACISTSIAAGAAGAIVSGPFGVATGFVGGNACRYVFQTLVEKYGGKKAACKIFS